MACSALAKQMMETTVDAVTNAKVVVGYGLSSYDELSEPAQFVIKGGYFYGVAELLVKAYDDNLLPLPDTSDPLAAFLDNKR